MDKPLDFDRAKLSGERKAMQKLIQLYQSRRFDEVIEATSKMLKKDPKSSGLWNLQGASYAALHDLRSALKAFRQAEKFDPKNADIKNNIGNVLSAEKRFGEAEKYFKRAIRVRPNFHLALTNLATVLREQGRLDEAVTNYEAAIAANASYPAAFNGLGSVLARKNMHEKANAMYDAAIKLNPKYAEAYSNKAVCLAEMGDHGKAIENHKISIALRPKDAEYHFAMANTLLEAGEPDKAFRCYTKTVALDPSHDVCKAKVGAILLEGEEFEKAEAFFLGIVRRSQEDQLALSFLAKAMLGLDKVKEIVMLLRDRINAGENSFESLDRLGSILRDEKQYLEALEVYAFAVAKYPKNAQALIKLGDIRKKMNDLPSAIKLYSDAINICPDEPTFKLKLGDCHFYLGAHAEAAEIFRKATRIRSVQKKSISRLSTLPIGTLRCGEIRELHEKWLELRSSVEPFEYEAISANLSLQELDFDSFCAKIRIANELKLAAVQYDIGEAKLKWEATKDKISFLECFSAVGALDLPKLVVILGPSTSGKSTLEILLSKSDRVIVRDEAVNFSVLESYTSGEILKMGTNERRRLFTAVFYDENADVDRPKKVFVCTNPFVLHAIHKVVALVGDIQMVLCNRDRTSLMVDQFRKFYQNGNLYSYDLGTIKDELENYFDAMGLLKSAQPKLTHWLDIQADGRFDPVQLQDLGRALGLELSDADSGQGRRTLFLDSIFYEEISKRLGIA